MLGNRLLQKDINNHSLLAVKLMMASIGKMSEIISEKNFYQFCHPKTEIGTLWNE